MKKAQMAFELIVGIGTLSIFFLAFSGVILSQRSDIINSERNERIDSFGKELQQKFFLASNMREGFYIRIVLPEKISGNEYDLEIINNNMYITQDSFSMIYIIPEVIGTISSNEFLLVKAPGGLMIS